MILIEKRTFLATFLIFFFDNINMSTSMNRRDELSTFFNIKNHLRSFRNLIRNILNKQLTYFINVPYSGKERSPIFFSFEKRIQLVKTVRLSTHIDIFENNHI